MDRLSRRGRLPRSTCRLVVLGLAVAACGAPPDSSRPDIVLISIDTLRADRLGSYGFTAETTPALDALAAEGVRFERAISQASWTLPAHMSLFTSQYVDTHRVVNERTALAPDAQTLAATLSAAGYRTAGFASWVYLSPGFGFGRGFDEYYMQLDPERLSLAGGGGAQDARQVVEAVRHWLANTDEHPYFLFVHLFDPHLDYRPPPPYDRLFTGDYNGPIDGTYAQLKPQILGLNPDPPPIDPAARDHLDGLYQGEIRFVDDQIERLLDAVAARSDADDTFVIVVSDHGEEIGDHGSLEGHGWTLYEEITRVPLLIRFPRQAHRGRVVESPVGLIDLGPTVLDYLGLEIPATFQGRSLVPLIEHAADPAATAPVLSDSGGRFAIFKRSAQGHRFKLIETKETGVSQLGLPIAAGFELYDLLRDPGEQRNLFAPDHPAAAELLAVLTAADRRSDRAAAEVGTAEHELSQDERRMLESLGYIQ